MPECVRAMNPLLSCPSFQADSIATNMILEKAKDLVLMLEKSIRTEQEN